MLTENTKSIIAWLNVCVIWGTTYLVIRIGVGHMPPMLFAGIRWVIAGIIFIVIIGSLVGYTSYIYAIAKLPLSLISTYAYINPVIALFLGWIILDEKLNFQIAIAAAVILAGVFTVKKGTAKLKPS
jgi:drug/metabolite transporter (DMT)-like permease